MRLRSNFIDLHVAVQLSPHHLLKRLSFSHCIFLPPLLKINWPSVCGFISGLSILFHWFICLFLCQYHACMVTVALLHHLKSRSVMPPALFFFSSGFEAIIFNESITITYLKKSILTCLIYLTIKYLQWHACHSDTKISGASQMVLVAKDLPANAGDIKDVGSIPGLGRSFEKGMATLFSILAWRIPWTEKPGRLQSMGSQELDTTWQLNYVKHNVKFKIKA